MSYTAHGFTPGHKLTALELNEMDEQIARSEGRVDAQQATIDQLPATLRRRLSRLKLETDEERAYLFDGEKQLSEIALPGVLEGLVPCTGFSVLTEGPLLGYAGGPELEIETARQPNDCTQGVLFASKSPDVFTVSSAGRVTPLTAGIAHVAMRCGAFTETLPVRIGQRFAPTAEQHHLTGRVMWYEGSGNLSVDTAGSGAITYVTLFTDAALQIPDGCTLRVELASPRLQLITLAYLLPETGAFSYSGARPEQAGEVWLRINSCPAVLDAKSNGERTEGGANYTGSFARGEGAAWVNDTGKTAFLVLALELWDDDGEGNFTGRQATAEDIPFVQENLIVTVTPGE